MLLSFKERSTAKKEGNGYPPPLFFWIQHYVAPFFDPSLCTGLSLSPSCCWILKFNTRLTLSLSLNFRQFFRISCKNRFILDIVERYQIPCLQLLGNEIIFATNKMLFNVNMSSCVWLWRFICLLCHLIFAGGRLETRKFCWFCYKRTCLAFSWWWDPILEEGLPFMGCEFWSSYGHRQRFQSLAHSSRYSWDGTHSQSWRPWWCCDWTCPCLLIARAYRGYNASLLWVHSKAAN